MWFPEQKTADLVYDFADQTIRQVPGGTIIGTADTLTTAVSFFDAGTVFAVLNAALAP